MVGPIGTKPSGTPESQARVRNITIAAVFVAALVILFAMIGVIPVNPLAIAQRMTVLIGGLALAYFLYLFAFAGLDGDEMKRTAVIVVLFVFSAILCDLRGKSL